MTTTKVLRREIRELVDVGAIVGRLPLDDREISAAYERLDGCRPPSEWSAAKTRHVTLQTACSITGDDVEREPYDAGKPYTKPELQTMKEALETIDSTASEATDATQGEA